MTDKINGIDVSECEHYKNNGKCRIPHYQQGIKYVSCNCNEWDCAYKQLKHSQKENEELRQVRKNSPDIQEPYVYLYRQIKKQCYMLEEKIKSEKYIKENALQEATKYSMKCGEFRQALKEIRNEIGNLKDINKLINLQKISDKINKVLNDGD